MRQKHAKKQTVRNPETVGVSPKVIAALLTSLVTFLVTKLGLDWNPILEQAINAVAPVIAAVVAKPGKIKAHVSHAKPPPW